LSIWDIEFDSDVLKINGKSYESVHNSNNSSDHNDEEGKKEHDN
jgi:hypothetical protein